MAASRCRSEPSRAGGRTVIVTVTSEGAIELVGGFSLTISGSIARPQDSILAS